MAGQAFKRAGLLACCLAIGWLALPGALHAQGRPAMVSTETVEIREVADTVQVFGQIVPARESAVASRVAGIVDEVMVRVGDTVAAGAPLARLDTRLLEIELAAAEAERAVAEAGLEVAEARLTQARQAFERAQALSENATISQGQLEDRAGALAEASGARNQALARILAASTDEERARYELRNATIVAPFAGTVLNVAADPGAFVGVGSDIATLLDDGAVEIEAAVPARFVGALSEGLAVGARTDGGGTLDLTVRAILPTEVATTRTRPVRLAAAAVDAGSAPLAVGQSVTLELPVSAPRSVLTVPKDAVTQARGAWSVFVAEDGKAVPREVELGAAVGERFEVLSGLAPGDEVVVRGNERLRPMQDILTGPPGGGPPGAGGAPEPTEEARRQDQ